MHTLLCDAEDMMTDKRWLRAFAFRGRLRIYEDYILPGFEVVVLDANDTHVTIATHDLYKTYTADLTWEAFCHQVVLAPDTTAEKQALCLRNTLRNIATTLAPGAALAVERFIDNPPSLEDIVVKKAKKSNVSATACVRADYNRHTCIELERDGERVTFLPMFETGLDVQVMGIEHFERDYERPLPDYPVEKAALLYLEFAQHLGATPAALDALARFITIGKKEYDMATAKPVTAGKKPATATAAKDEKAVKTTKKADAAPKAPKEKKPSAAARFQELIMAGKLTDDDIFATVKKEFDLSDDKRGYVTWYRNHLRKNGKTPPPVVEPKGAAKKDAPAAKSASKDASADKAAAPAAKKAPAVKKSTVSKPKDPQQAAA